MKKLKYLLFSGLIFAICLPNVFAAGSAGLSVSKSTIENGQSVTASATIRNTAAWNITISSSGSTSGCTEKFVGDSGDGNNTSKTFSVTCKSTSTGIINFTLSGDITSSDGTNTKISGNKSVTVTVPRTKSSNNDMSSLSVEGYEITPAFSNSIKEYSLTVPSTVNLIKINASAKDKYASISGTGEVAVEEGVNSFEIVVTSETGVTNTFKLNVSVEDQNPINVKVDGKNYTVIKNPKNLVLPELFTETTIKIDEFDIPAFINEKCNITLVGLKDEMGNVSLFIYKDGSYEKYNSFLSDRLSIIVLEMNNIPKGYSKTTLKINDEKVVAYKTKGNDNYLIYALNIVTGEKNYYTYDNTEKTLQKFDVESYEKEYKDNQTKDYILYAFSSLIVVLLILVITQTTKIKKLSKNSQKIIDKINDIKEKKKEEPTILDETKKLEVVEETDNTKKEKKNKKNKDIINQ